MAISPRIAVVTDFAGIVLRGAEGTADDFQRMLCGEVTVVSLAGSRPPGGVFPNTEWAGDLFCKMTKRLVWLDEFSAIILRNKPRRLIGTYNFFSSAGWLDYIFSTRLPDLLDELRPEVVFSIGYLHTQRVLSSYCRSRHIPLIGIYGGGPNWEMRIMANKLNHGIVVSTPMELQFIRHNEPKVKSILIPLGVDTDIFQPGLGSENSHLALQDLKRPIIYSASAFVPHKRLHLLVDAVAVLGHGSLVLTGDGPLRDALLQRGMKKLGPERFRYLGTVPTKYHLVPFYQNADVYALSSYNEQFGNVLLEAMACGKPVVATDDATRRWIVGDAGILVNVEDSQAFANALRQAAETDWNNRPRRRADFFSLTRMAAALDQLIAGCLDGNPNYVSRYEREWTGNNSE